jgi:hypothetical protein
MALYLHFGEFVNWVVDQIGAEIGRVTAVSGEAPQSV